MNKFFCLSFIALFAAISSKAIFFDLDTDDVVIENNTTCKTCLFVGQLVKHEIDVGNNTITNITHFIEDICNEIKGPSGHECMLVVKAIQQMVNLFAQGFNVTQICHKLGFCP